LIQKWLFHWHYPHSLAPNHTWKFELELRAIVGEAHVITLGSKEQLDDGHYMNQPKAHDSFHLLAQDDLIASCTVEPATVEYMQEIVKLANNPWPETLVTEVCSRLRHYLCVINIII
jgi:hypothetical protein